MTGCSTASLAFVLLVGVAGGLKATDAPDKAPSFHLHKLLYNQNEWVMSQAKKEALKQGRGLAKNLCEERHYLPEVFILGAPSAGTTTLAADFDRSPAVQFATGHGPMLLGQNRTHKEGHFFDFYHHAGDSLLPHSFPACQQKTKIMAVDASSRYLMDSKVPERIHNRYSHVAGQAGRTKFIVLLRDPLYRLHSDFYHSLESGLCSMQTHQSFGTFLMNFLEGGPRSQNFVGGRDHCSDRVEGSLYRDQLVNWFRWFPQPQFTIVPWLFAVAPGVDGRRNVSVAEGLWKTFGIQGAAPSFGTHLGRHDHPTFEEEGLKAKVIAQARKWFDDRTGPRRLAELFAMGGSESKRARLFGYKGDPEDQETIASWIETNWGQAPRRQYEAVKLGAKRHHWTNAMENTMPADDRKGIEDYNVLLARAEHTYSTIEWVARRVRKAAPKEHPSIVHNLCQSGWVLPKHYLLGAPSGGTTSFASDLDASPSIQFPRGWGEGRLPEGQSYKEAHTLDTYFRAGHWFHKMCYVPCDEKRNLVASDATARYLLDPTVPDRLKERYSGHNFNYDMQALKEVKFSVLLRDPLDRFHSDFYSSKKADLCKRTANMTFAAVVQDLLTGGAEAYMGGHGGCSDRLEGSLYADQVKRWFRKFHSSQFTIVPWLYQVAPGVDGRDSRTLAEATWEQLGADPATTPPAGGTHLMKGSHPTLQEEGLSADQLQDLRLFFDRLAGPQVLAKVLVSSGANLYGYLGADNDEQAIASWLQTNWKSAPPS